MQSVKKIIDLSCPELSLKDVAITVIKYMGYILSMDLCIMET